MKRKGGYGFPILALGKAKQTRAEKSTAMRKSTKRSPEVRFNFLLEDKGFFKSIVVVVAFSAIPIEMIEILV